MLNARPLVVDGKMWGTIYTFDNAGDVFAVHTHETDRDNHTTAVLFGSIKLTGHPKYEGVVLEAKSGGTVVNWVVGEPHGFVAMTDGATIMNLLKVRP